MDFLSATLEWFFVTSIYGGVLIIAAIYLLAKGLKKKVKRFPNPEVIGGIAFLLAVFTMPSIPRYTFERQTLADIEGKDWIRIVETTRWGGIAEPLTWVNTPIGAFHIVTPELEANTFRETVLRYDDDHRVRIVTIYCDEREISISMPGAGGVFRYIENGRFAPMNDRDAKVYCNYDWSKEREAAFAEFSRKDEPSS